MPIYEYYCGECNRKFELLVRNAADTDGVKCSACRSGKVRRVFSVFGVKSGSSFRPATGSGCSGCGGGDCSTCR